MTGATGGDTRASEAPVGQIVRVGTGLSELSKANVLIPSALLAGVLGGCDATGVGASVDSPPLMVDVEEEREKVEVKGARCISFTSGSKLA